MVNKRKRLAKKPTAPSPDSWVKDGGLDPAIQPTPIAEQEPEESKGKPYPHRVSFDMATAQYKRLKRAAFEEERSLNDVLREAVEDWMKARGY